MLDCFTLCWKVSPYFLHWSSLYLSRIKCYPKFPKGMQLERYHSKKSLSSPQTNGPPPPVIFLPQPPPSSRSIFYSQESRRKIRGSVKKIFFPGSLHKGVKEEGHRQNLLISCPRLLNRTLLVNCIKKVLTLQPPSRSPHPKISGKTSPLES